MTVAVAVAMAFRNAPATLWQRRRLRYFGHVVWSDAAGYCSGVPAVSRRRYRPYVGSSARAVACPYAPDRRRCGVAPRDSCGPVRMVLREWPKRPGPDVLGRVLGPFPKPER